jgi:hypothetical protein
VTDLHNLNTILQLAVALNIVCIAASFKNAQFGNILEGTILKTKIKIHERIEKILLFIVTGANSLEKLKNLTSDQRLVRRIDRITSEYDHIRIDLDNAAEKLNIAVDEECTPLHIAGLCSFWTLWGIVSLFFIVFSEILPDSIFSIYVYLSVLYLILFISIKTYLNRWLFNRIKNSDSEKKEILEKKMRNIGKLLGVKSAAFILLGVIILAVIIHFAIARTTFFASNLYLINMAQYISPMLPFSSFFVYIVVTYFYNNRRLRYINDFFIPIESKITGFQKSTNEIDIFIKVDSQLKIETD